MPDKGAGGKIAFDPPTRTAWAEHALCLDDGSYDAQCRVLSLLDTNTKSVTATVSVAQPVKTLAADPGARRILVVSRTTDYSSPDTLSAIDADSRKEILTVPLSFSAEDIVIDPETHHALITGLRGATMVDTRDLTEMDLGLDPTSNRVLAAVDSSRGRGVIGWETKLMPVDLQTANVGELHPFSVGVGNNAIAFDPLGYLIFSDSENDEVRVFDADRQVHFVDRAGRRPTGLTCRGPGLPEWCTRQIMLEGRCPLSNAPDRRSDPPRLTDVGGGNRPLSACEILS